MNTIIFIKALFEIPPKTFPNHLLFPLLDEVNKAEILVLIVNYCDSKRSKKRPG